MNKWVLGVLFLGGTTALWAQTTVTTDPNIKVSSSVGQAPVSSVDLLQQSVQKNSSIAFPSSTKAPKVPPKPVVKTTPSSTTASTSTVTAPVPTTGANTLDMPLPIGGTNTSVQTEVAPAKPKTTVRKVTQASTAPVTTVASTGSATGITVENTDEEDAADAELEYAVKMLEKSKADAQSAERKIPPSASKNRPTKVPSPNKAFNPNSFRPGVEWLPSKSKHFDIYTQKPNGSMGSANMSLTFETAYQTLYRFIPWMMSDKARAFVYQDHNSYLRYEPEAQAWTRAMAYPTRGEIVVYDEPGHIQELQEVFSHELTHIFTQQFFDKHKTGRLMTPLWLDEGLAVYVEDHMNTGRRRGGPWDHDYRTLRFERDPSTMANSFASTSMFGFGKPKSFQPPKYRQEPRSFKRHGKPVRLLPFEEFMKDSSLSSAEGQNRTQTWYLQAYLMVRFLLEGEAGHKMKFQQFTRLIAEGEAVRNPSTGFLVKDSRGKQVYEPYSVEKALAKAYHYNSIAAFEDAFWNWLQK